jgi:hypothetical protein
MTKRIEDLPLYIEGQLPLIPEPILDTAERIVRTARSDLASLEVAIRVELEKRDLRIRELEARLHHPQWHCVILESPYAGDVETNLRYLRALMRDCISRGESPYASHGLLTQAGVLDDLDPEERRTGITAGFAWAPRADYVVVGVDLGVSHGMRLGIDNHRANGRTVVERSLAGWRK